MLPAGLFSREQAAQAAPGDGTPGIVTTPTIPAPVPEATPPKHYVVVLVIDAGQASDVDLRSLPHIRALMQNGVTYDQ
ncbi:MAG TPA: hypothetical protein VF221_20795, partial [Chloroflexota bacterium]